MIVIVLLDAFETMVLPRRVRGWLRITRWFFRGTWTPWRAAGLKIHRAAWQETWLSIYGPGGLILLLVMWAALLVLGFGVAQWAIGPHLGDPLHPASFRSAVYFSGTTFFTLGLGDIHPTGWAARALTIVESGTGFGFLALVIGYLPVIYQSFSRRELAITLLDARAGSPPTATEVLRRAAEPGGDADLQLMLRDWERWAADLLESQLSYPALGWFRSHHDRQSWVGALTAVLDTSAVIMTSPDSPHQHQARLTFAIARHAAVDLVQVYGRTAAGGPMRPLPDRGPAAVTKEPMRADLIGLRDSYEPYVLALSRFLAVSLPPWSPTEALPDDWQTGPEKG
jgi:hypothetical protein